MHLRFVINLFLLSFSLNGWAIQERTLNNGQLILQDIPDIPAALEARLNQFQNVRSASFVEWAEDGKGMYIRTRFGDTTQLHRVDSAGGTRHQLTFFDEPVQQAVRAKKGRRLALTMDQGGTENSQIFIFDPRDASTEMVSDGRSRNRLLVWNRKGTLLAYQSTRRDGQNNDVWVMDPDRPEGARPVLRSEAGSWWGPVGFTRDDRYLLVQQYISVLDSRIYLLDLKTSRLVLLAGHPAYTSANRAVALDPSRQGFYMISNARGFGAELAWKSFDAAEPAVFITTTVQWDVSEFAISEDGTRGAFVVNEDGISQLYLLDAARIKFKRVGKMPVGVIFNLSFHSDNRRLAMNLNTAQSPSDVFVMQLGRSATSNRGLTRWTYSEVGGLQAEDFVEPTLVRYPTFDLVGEEPRTVPAFVYKPRGKGPHPVIIYIHGGPESQFRPSFNAPFQMWLRELGAAVIAPNVRGSIGYGNEYVSLDNGLKREDAVRDIGALLDWIALQDDLDQSRVAVFGGSYGGYMVLASAVHYSDRLKAAVDVVGISNFVTFLKNTKEYRRDLRRTEYGDERIPEIRAFLEQISPLNNVDRINVPLMVVQGANDPRVPASEAEQIVRALRSRQLPVWYMNALNEGHGYQKKENRDIYQQVAIMFMKKYLLGESA